MWNIKKWSKGKNLIKYVGTNWGGKNDWKKQERRNNKTATTNKIEKLNQDQKKKKEWSINLLRRPYESSHNLLEKEQLIEEKISL